MSMASSTASKKRPARAAAPAPALPIWERWLRAFEAPRSPYPLAVFRILFFAALALHFFPSLLRLDDSYSPRLLRTEEWSHWLYVRFWRIPHGWLRAMSVVTMLACLAGLVGLRPRIAAAVAFAGCYAFASFNGLHVQTLALLSAWAVLMLMALCGGGSAVWSVDAVLRRWRQRRRGSPASADAPPTEPGLLPSLLLFQLLLAVFFAGIEKLLAGWPGSNEMGILMSYPRGFMLRDWAVSASFLHGEVATSLMTWLTILVELGTPILLLVGRTRRAALLAYQLFFLGIIAMMEVPPLFYLLFAGGALLALRDSEVAWVLARFRARPAAGAPTGPAA
ncbi:MAG: HTTM domain-containing protein [Deltaproteobacteria bacterium]|nr:HTTM domain-containing protein [Deltaproteobacteria bacterium]